MEQKICNSFNEFVAAIDGLSSKNELVFRGHSSVDYKLIPSIGRIEKYSQDIEKSVFLEFKSKYYSYTSLRLERDMDVLFLAQHYGIPTRLLDWTLNPLIALYFACNSKEEKDGVIFVKDIQNGRYNFKEEKKDVSPFEIQNNTILIPDYWDSRFINQRGVFEIFANPQKECDNNHKKIIIPKEQKKRILNMLRLCGIDETYIYPSLDSLSGFIKRKYNIKYLP